MLTVLSGACGLAYEILWVRLLGLQFGVSNLAAVVTVSAFMLGLAGGSAFMTGRAVRSVRPLLQLALLEAGVAAFALSLPLAVERLTPLIDAAAGSLTSRQWHSLLLLAGLMVLTVPAAAMGAGFPLLVESWRRHGRGIGAAYGANTLGAAFGALLPLILLPSLGWNIALRTVAVVNLAVAAGLAVLDRMSRARLPAAAAALDGPRMADAARPTVLMLTYGMIGAASLLLELSWLRLFSLLMLRTEYVLSMILAVMLLGMGVGSLLASRWPRLFVLSMLPWCASGFALLGLWLLPAVSAWLERVSFDSLASALLVQGSLLAALTLPVTLALGAWLPSLTARFGVDGSSLYASNSMGAAIGGGGYVMLVPLIGNAGAVALAAGIFAFPQLWLWGRSRQAGWGLAAVAAAAAGLSVLPPVNRLMPQTMGGSHDLYRYEDAIAMTQVVEENTGQRVLLTDLRWQDASTEPTAVFVQTNQARLPLLLHPHPRSVLFLGVGTGISLAGSLPFPDLKRTAVELSAGSIEAARRWFVASNRGVLQKTLVYQDDARHFLSANRVEYDVIIGDVFHPDLAGSGSLLSVEQFQRVRARLGQGGLYAQWLALNQFDPAALAIVLRSFRLVFPDGRLFLDGMHLALLGARDKWLGAPTVFAHLDSLTAGERIDATAGEADEEWLGRYWGPIVANSGPVQHDFAPRLEFSLPHRRYDPGASVSGVLRWLLAQRPSLRSSSDTLDVSISQQPSFKRAYIGTELWVRSELANWEGNTLEADRLLGLAFEADPHDRWILYALSDRLLANLPAAAERGIAEEQLVRKVLAINPWSVEAWRLLWRLQRARKDPDAPLTKARLQELSPMDFEVRASMN